MHDYSYVYYLLISLPTQIVRSKALVVTSPGYVTAEILGNSKNGVLPAAAELGKINYPPVASVTIAYPNSAFKVQYYSKQLHIYLVGYQCLHLII